MGLRTPVTDNGCDCGHRWFRHVSADAPEHRRKGKGLSAGELYISMLCLLILRLAPAQQAIKAYSPILRAARMWLSGSPPA
jgi:hypothetical protein